MIVNIVECFAGVRRAKGLVVVIDVFRSSTVACFLAAGDRGGDYIATNSLDQARKFAKEYGGKVLGELEGVGAEAFDYNNSPFQLDQLDLAGQALVHVTNAGTWGMMHCSEADEVIVGCFVNAAAVVNYIRRQAPETVTLVAMGTNGDMRAQEDMMCAMFIKNELENYPNSIKTLKTFLAGVDSAGKFFDESRTDCPQEDFDLCMDLNRFDFVLKAEPLPGGVRLKKITVSASETA
ncbi:MULTISPECIES: 2-phosphosulfolactate phosphatase [unclassified Pseudodesulfovibrio]|uniref:2-phosphosulfolactate phosphatase n=1 Tax=unclassified Pseudodesulfovibrio TaxID=2661612 RepID=UPI000FEC008F|nr:MULTISPECIES: 2-phosphosulfolactate phosphatase [unclassified Pseudodesulfovibrio]MCJ2164227.1 2-phosphosulfolactate phosphatase [Pseudodesulfovibrio sp. S3-i]RWU05149.1 2-phosphosulfolactate phosphatase [Pseudodesulfovibrio sp. S3]